MTRHHQRSPSARSGHLTLVPPPLPEAAGATALDDVPPTPWADEATRARVAAVAFGDWSTDSALSPEVQEQISRWRRIREGPGTRRRVITQDGKPCPTAQRAPGPPPLPPAATSSTAMSAPLVAAVVPSATKAAPATAARAQAQEAMAPREATTEIAAFDPDAYEESAIVLAPRWRPSLGMVAFAALFVGSAAAIAWTIAKLV